jgi:glycosyltransferase involved in cell wall biosynthesis
MTLGVHMGTLRGAGAVAVGRPLATELVRASGGALRFWVPDAWARLNTGAGVAVHVEAVPAVGFRSKLHLENVVIRRAVRRGEIDALFSVGDTSMPACSVPHLLLVQNAYLAYAESEWGCPDAALRRKMVIANMYFRLGLPTVTRLAVQTRTMKARLTERWQLDEDRVVVIPSSISAVFLGATPLPAADPPYVCFIGSAIAHKNHLVVAEMLALLKRRGVHVKCRLNGVADDVPHLVRAAHSLGVGNDFEFLGCLEPADVCRLMQRATALIMPSRVESFGLPFFEAMAVGCPVIAADRDFARDACADVARYADADDASGFADHVQALLADPALRSRMAAAGCARTAQTHRPWSGIAQDYLHVIAEIGGPRLTLQNSQA